MRLNDLLPKTYEYRGDEIEIDLTFDNILDIFDVLKSKDLFEVEMAELSMILLFGADRILPEDYPAVFNDVFETYLKTDEEEIIEYDLAGNPMPSDKIDKEGVIDLEQDAEYLFASFMQAYKINLYEAQGSLHWLEFKALLNGLPEDTIIKQIIHIRTWEPSKDDPQEYKEKMKKLQSYYRIKDKEEVD